jgi:hypothetical protein
MKHHTVAKL